MPTYEQLYHLNLSNLSAAADSWEEAAAKFTGLHTAYGDQVAGPFRQAGWTQPAETAAKADSDMVASQQQFESAYGEAKGIASVLTSLHAELKNAKEYLHQLADVEAPEQGLYISANGTVTPRNDLAQNAAARHDPDGRAAISAQQDACEAFVRAIESALQRAAEADDAACQALRGQVRDGGTFKTAGALNDTGTGGGQTKTDGWVAEGKAEASGLGAGATASGPNTGTGKLAEAEAHADLARASAEGSLTNGPLKLAGAAEAYVGAKASAAAGITNEGIRAEATAFAGAEASANGRADAGPVGVYGRVEAKAGAEATAGVGIGLDGVHAGAEAFAGAKAGAAGGADIGGIGVGATAEGWAGIGASADATLGKGTDGKWHIGTKVGAAVGLGGQVGFEVTVDPGKIADTASSAAHAIGDAAGWVGGGIASLF